MSARAEARVFVVGVLLLGVLATGVGSTDVLAAPSQTGSGVPERLVDRSISTVQAANNTTVQHENPEQVDEQGDIGQLERWLGGRLGNRLTESSVSLSQGEYEAARSVIGDRYRDQLEKYVDVAGETGSDGDDRAAESFEQAREAQETYTKRVQRFRETYKRYQHARANGNRSKARRLARRLGQIATEVNETGTELQGEYDRLSNTTAADLTRAERAIENTTENTTETATEVRETTLVATHLEARVESSRISVRDPARIGGRLLMANGTPIANRNVRIRITAPSTNDTLFERRVRTDSDGQFAVTYRPTWLPLDTRTLTVRYVPRNASRFAGSQARVTVRPMQTNASLTVAADSTSAQFGQSVVISGRVSVDGQQVKNVPVVVSLDGNRIARVRTTANGTYAYSLQVPADVPPGEREIRAALPAEDRVIAAEGGVTSVRIVPTDTQLALDANRIEAGGFRVVGRLTTVDDLPASDRSIRILVNGTIAATTRTDEDGEYAITVSAEQFEPSGVIAITARFIGEGTNLRQSRARMVLRLSSEGNGGAQGIQRSIPRWIWVVIGSALLFGLLLVNELLVRDDPRFPSPFAATDDEGNAEASDAAATPSSEQGTEDAEATGMLNPARERLAAGNPRSATILAYGAAREQLVEHLDRDRPLTHWEFLEACARDGLNDAETTTLRQLTEAYEQAAFSPDRVRPETAEGAIDDARRLVVNDE